MNYKALVILQNLLTIITLDNNLADMGDATGSVADECDDDDIKEAVDDDEEVVESAGAAVLAMASWC